MSELNNLKNMEKAIPKMGSTAKGILAGVVGNYMAKGKSGFSKKETTNRMVDRTHAANVENEMKNRDAARELTKSKQFSQYKAEESTQSHNQALEKQRFEADTVHEIAARYSNVTEIKHGGTSVKFSKRGSSKPVSSKTGSKPKNVKKTNNKKSK
jgi:hypothetical protein